jgi:hypothetical protein
MEEARKLDLRPLIAVAGLVAVVLTMWAAGAFAAGGSSSDNSPSGSPIASIQEENNGQQRSREDCPRDREGSGGSQRNEGSLDL